MTEAQRVSDWIHLYKVSVSRYQMSTLISCYKNDGEQVLRKVLKNLGMELSLELVKDACK
jgi:hypothetical protein